MKLSKLIEALQELQGLAKTDPEVIVWLDDLRLEFHNTILEASCLWNTGIGELTPMPEWEEELTLYMTE